MNAEFQRITGRDKKSFLSGQCKEIQKNNTVEMTSKFKGLDIIECLKNYGWRFITL